MSDSELRMECYRLTGSEMRSALDIQPDHEKRLRAAKELYQWCTASHVLTVSENDFNALVRSIPEKELCWDSKRDKRLLWGGIIVRPQTTNTMVLGVE